MYNNFFTIFEITEPPPISRKTYTRTDKRNSNLNNYPMMVVTDAPDLYNTPAELDELNPFVFQTEQLVVPDTQKPVKPVLESPTIFANAFKKACEINPEVEKYKNFLLKTADVESSFNPKAIAVTGKHYGWFQMGVLEIKAATGMSPLKFMDDPVQLILGAVKLYKIKLANMKNNGAYSLGISKNFSEDALVAGAWLGGEQNVLKYLQGKGDASDSHQYKKVGKKGGTSISKRMNEFNNYGVDL